MIHEVKVFLAMQLADLTVCHQKYQYWFTSEILNNRYILQFSRSRQHNEIKSLTNRQNPLPLGSEIENQAILVKTEHIQIIL